jgi:hypothetical protein
MSPILTASAVRTVVTGVLVELWASDRAYDLEVQSAPDSAGSPNVGAATTIATGIPGTQPVYLDPQPLDNAVRWYRLRHVGFGDSPSPYTGWVSGKSTTIPANALRGAATAAIITTAKTQTATLGTLTVTVVDPQSRVTLVETQTVVSGGAPGAWAPLPITGGSGTATVTVAPGPGSSIAYRVTGYDVDGVLKVLAGETLGFATAAGPIAPLPTLDWSSTDTSDLVASLTMSVVAGTTALASLTYTLTQKLGKAAPTTLASGPATALPLTVTVARVPKQLGWYVLTITDALTGQTSSRVPLGDDGRDGARTAGTATGRTSEDDARAGTAGIPVRGGRIITEPYFSDDGVSVLLDPTLRRIGASLGYTNGQSVDGLRPGEAGANVTETRTAADVLFGAGKAVRQSGADVTGSNTANDVLVGGGRAVQETGANNTESRTANDAANVGGTPSGTVRDRARWGGPRNAGHGYGRDGEDLARGGSGGIPVPGARYHTEPIYDPTGLVPLIDTTGKQMLSGLAIGAGVRGDPNVAFGPSAGRQFAPNRHNEGITAKDAASKTFAVPFENAPEIKVIPQVYLAPTAGNKVKFQATGVSTAGFTAIAQQISGSTSTPASNNFSPTFDGATAASVAISAQGAAAYCDLGSANATSTTYTATYDVDTTAMSAGKLLRVQLWYNTSATDNVNWALAASNTYDIGQILTGETLSLTATLGVGYDLRIVLSYSATPAATATVTCKTVTYNVVTAGTPASLTVAGDDTGVLFLAVEKS